MPMKRETPVQAVNRACTQQDLRKLPFTAHSVTCMGSACKQMCSS